MTEAGGHLIISYIISCAGQESVYCCLCLGDPEQIVIPLQMLYHNHSMSHSIGNKKQVNLDKQVYKNIQSVDTEKKQPSAFSTHCL